MDEKIIKLQLRKVKLLQAIEDTKKKKEKIISIVQSLVKELNNGRIRREEYEHRLNHFLKNRMPEQWIKYYDDYIKYYNSQIKSCDKLIDKAKKKEKPEKKEHFKKEKITVYEGWEEKPRKIKLTPILSILIGIVLIAIIISFFINLKPLENKIANTLTEKISTTISQFTQKAPEKITAEAYEEPEIKIILENEQIRLSEESLTQYQAVVGQTVKWKKQFTVDSATGFSVELPKGSKNIEIKSSGKNITDTADISKKRSFLIFGEKSTEIKLSKTSITGNAVFDNQEKQEYEILFETPAPIAEEEIIPAGKRIMIRGPDDIHYKNILSFTELQKELSKEESGKLKLYQIKDGQRELVRFTAYDSNENGMLDFIEWIIPELSDAEFLLVIEISEAEHLDENRDFISDVYNSVRALDGNWSENINDKEYVRVTFKQKLDSTKDITLYPRIVSGNPRIEVYEVRGIEKIAEFSNLTENEYNKIYLNNLVGEQDVFDLKVIGGSIEIEHIIDPYILVWRTPVAVSSFSSEAAPLFSAIKSIDGSIGGLDYWSEGIDVDASNYEWYITYDMGDNYSISKIRVSAFPTSLYSPCKIGSIRICKEPSCSGEANKILSTCIFSGSAQDWYECAFQETTGRYIEISGGIWRGVSCDNFDSSFSMGGFYEFQAYINPDTGAPDIKFTPPTPNNGADVYYNFLINVSANDTRGGNNVSVFIDFDNSLAGWWRMDDTVMLAGNTVVLDYTGKNNGTAQGDAVQTYDGYMGKGFNFDGDGDYIDIGNKVISDGSPEYTACAYFNATGGAGTIRNIFHAPGTMGFGCKITASNILSCSIGGASVGATPVNINKWYQVCSVYRQNNYFIIYLNGMSSIVTTLGGSSLSTNGFHIGANETGRGGWFNGIIDDVIIFNRTLSAAEIEGLYANKTLRYVLADFSNSTVGSHKFKAYAQDSSGRVNQTEERSITYTGAKITSCRRLERANTTYFLDANIINNALTDNCINITAQNITLDCKRYYISSDDDYTGVYSNQYNTTIKNCNISMGSGGGVGIYLNNANNSYIHNNIFLGQYHGLLSLKSRNVKIENNTLISNDYGLFIHTGFNNTAKNNSFIRNDDGIFAMFGGNHTFLKNQLNQNNYSIYLQYANSNMLVNNSILNCSPSGQYTCIYLYGSYYNLISGGILNKSKNNLILLGDSNNNQFKNIRLYDSLGDSVYVANSLNNVFDNLMISSNAEKSGIFSDSSNTTVKNCNISMGGSDGGRGIFFSSSKKSKAYNNLLYNQHTGIYVYSSSDDADINNNTFHSNTFYDLASSSSARIRIINNSFLGNGRYGLYISSSSNSIIFNNQLNNRTGSYTNVVFSIISGTNYTISNNIFNNLSGAAESLQLTNIQANNITGNVFGNCGGTSDVECMSLGNVDNSAFSNNVIYRGSQGNVVSAGNSDNNFFKDNNFTNSGAVEVYFNLNNLNNTFLNCSYQRESVSSGSELIRKWYYQAYVNNTDGAGLPNVNITAYNVTNNFNFNLTTVSSGFTPVAQITDYINTGGTKNYYSDYIINANNKTFFASHKLNVTKKTEESGFDGLIRDFFTLGFDAVAPLIEFVYPTPEDNSIQNTNSIYANVSARDSFSDISTFMDFYKTGEPDKKLLWFRMDELTFDGSYVIDNSSYKKNALVTGDAHQADDGKLGKGFEFDGTDSLKIDGAGARGLADNKDSFSISVWVKSKPGRGGNIAWQDYSGPESESIFLLFGGASGSFSFNVYNEITSDDALISGFVMSEWHHVAAVYNGTHIKLYIDAVNESDAVELIGPTNRIPDAPEYNPRFFIGGEGGGWNGSVDDFIFFDRVLAKEEIKALYANQTFKHLEMNYTGLFNGIYNITAYAQDLAGNVNKITRTIEVRSSLPQIIWIQDIPDVTPLLGGMRNVSFNFTAYDAEGYASLNDSSAKANFSKIGYEQSRESFTCLRIISQSSGNYANYTCTVGMLYFDEGGDWNISVLIADNNRLLGINDSTSFHYNYLTAVSNPSLLDWGTLAPGEVNKPVNNNPIIANNTGNVDILKIRVNGTNLFSGAYFIGVGNFSVNSSDGNGNGILLINGLAVNITNSSLPSKNSTSNGERKLYFYMKQVPYNLPYRTYQTITPWDITFILVAVSLKRKKKKINIPLNIFSLDLSPAEALCKYLRENKELNVREITGLINRNKSTVSINYKNSVKDMKEKIKEEGGLFVDINIFSNRKLSILESLISYLKKRGYKNIEIARLLNKDQRNISTLYSRVQKKSMQKSESKSVLLIPVTIFKQKISPAEALYRYLRENKKLKFNQIAELTNRDENTIWTEYHNSINKLGEKAENEQTEIYIDINIFSNRKLSILESLISYLKKRGYKNIEIARLLNKDQRNISTLYSRVQKKSE